MQVKQVSNALAENQEANTYKSAKSITSLNKKDLELQPNDASGTAWQNDLLINTLNNLENNIQMDNTHPLGKASNAPIASFEEALSELNYLNTDKFKADALGAQANIKVENILPLFTS